MVILPCEKQDVFLRRLTIVSNFDLISELPQMACSERLLQSFRWLANLCSKIIRNHLPNRAQPKIYSIDLKVERP